MYTEAVARNASVLTFVGVPAESVSPLETRLTFPLPPATTWEQRPTPRSPGISVAIRHQEVDN
jgi:hypothetical protein